jgi:hypothetical protein
METQVHLVCQMNVNQNKLDKVDDGQDETKAQVGSLASGWMSIKSRQRPTNRRWRPGWSSTEKWGAVWDEMNGQDEMKNTQPGNKR